MSNRRWLLIALLIVSLLMTVVPATAAPGSPGYQTVRVNAAGAGQGVQLRGSQILEVVLEANPSTGFAWYVHSVNGAVLRQRGDATFADPGTDLKLGAPQMQTLQFVGLAKGKSTLELVYMRPWEGAAANARTFSIDVDVASAAPAELWAPATVAEAPAVAESTLGAAPASFDWCALGGCPAVRDQGACGSCWSFGTVGPLEAQIKIQTGVEKDLAEQYLVSCNSEGWGCSGGWWAHDYHIFKYVAPQTAAGSVYESQFPYTATDGSCTMNYTKQEKVAEWYFVESESAVASTDAIKQAIIDHGPIAVAVCVNTPFQTYTGGVFNPSRPPCKTVNHAVVLVGWDDADGAWKMRNSWGPNWGEDGYMRIAYGASLIGYSANYVIYDSGTTPDPTPTPTTTAEPTPDPTATPTPTPTTVPGNTMSVADINMWSSVTSNNKYYVYSKISIVDNNGVAVSGASVSVQIVAPDGTYSGTGTTLADGTVTFNLRAKYAGTYTTTVTDVTHSSYTYNAAANVETTASISVP